VSRATESAMLQAVDRLTEELDAAGVERSRLIARWMQILALECAAHELDKRATGMTTGSQS
jgi:hypothetical protein